MKQYWVKWVTDYHTFNNVVITNKDYNIFSGGFKEYLYEEKTNGQIIYKILSLKFNTPAQPKKPGR